MDTPDTILTAVELAEIRAELTHYPSQSAASIEALKVLQKHRGWVSDEALKAVAALLEMSPEDLDSVATFYNLIFRKPVGKNVILCCDSVSCWILGADAVRERLSERLGIGLGETTADGAFTLLPIVCLGACDHAPVMMIGERLYQDVDPQAVGGILAEAAIANQTTGAVP
jgi:NADH-quinone oxidoreductase subunit E